MTEVVHFDTVPAEQVTTWIVKTLLTHDKAHLAEQWGTSMEFFAH